MNSLPQVPANLQIGEEIMLSRGAYNTVFAGQPVAIKKIRQLLDYASQCVVNQVLEATLHVFFQTRM